MTDTRLILVRHGESYANAEKFIGGLRSCRGLTDAGRWQAERLRDRLLREGDIVPDVLVSSSYPRALETARRLRVRSVSFLGFDGGKAKALSDLVLHFPIHDMQVAEDLHMIAGHLLLKHLL